MIIDVFRHGESESNPTAAKPKPFTADENQWIRLTHVGQLAAQGGGRMCEQMYGPDYFGQAVLACSWTVRAIESMMRMQFGANLYRRENGLKKSQPRDPLIMYDLCEPEHGSDDWTTPKWDWDKPFSSTGDTIAKCFMRVEHAYGRLMREASGSSISRIIIVTSGHVCRLVAQAATETGAKYWDHPKLPNPKNCEGYRICPADKSINPILFGNGVAVEPIPGI